jgi:hypothetical protein
LATGEDHGLILGDAAHPAIGRSSDRAQPFGSPCRVTSCLPFAATYYDEALGITETLGGTSAGESTARADEWPRILRFIGAVRGRPGV